MKINRQRLFPKLALIYVCGGLLACIPKAEAITNLTFSDQYVVGSFKFTPGNPADPNSVATYVNYMITLAPGASGPFSDMIFTRSTNIFANLPNANANIIAQANTTTISLGAGGVFHTSLQSTTARMITRKSGMSVT